MIPEQEITRLYLAAVNAAALANSGQKLEGLAFLRAGLQRVSGLSPEDQPWANQLAQDWQRVVEAYRNQFELAPANSDPVESP